MSAKTEIAWTDPASVTGKGTIRSDGYRLVYCPSYPRAKPGGFVFEHRLVMARLLGRPLGSNEFVHHKDGNKLNNAPSNLELTSNAEHKRYHMSLLTRAEKVAMAHGLVTYQKAHKLQRVISVIPCACGCGGTVSTPDERGRSHRFLNGHVARGRHWKWSKNHG